MAAGWRKLALARRVSFRVHIYLFSLVRAEGQQGGDKGGVADAFGGVGWWMG